LTTRILDRLCEGDVTHQQLADELGVELSDIQNACKRIRRAATIIRERHDERVAEEARKLLELEERAARPGGRRA
jgi:DNA-binding MarR family transcriptional regulator